jgi:hypothetical protein
LSLLIAVCRAADQFQPSVVFQGARPGFVYTTGQHGTGYYKETARPAAPAAAAAPKQAAAKPVAAATAAAPKQRPAGAGSESQGGSAVSGAAASQARQSPAAAAAGAAARRAAAAAALQPKVQRKVELQLPAVHVAAPKPQLVGQGQEVRRLQGICPLMCCCGVLFCALSLPCC